MKSYTVVFETCAGIHLLRVRDEVRREWRVCAEPSLVALRQLRVPPFQRGHERWVGCTHPRARLPLRSRRGPCRGRASVRIGDHRPASSARTTASTWRSRSTGGPRSVASIAATIAAPSHTGSVSRPTRSPTSIPDASASVGVWRPVSYVLTCCSLAAGSQPAPPTPVRTRVQRRPRQVESLGHPRDGHPLDEHKPRRP